MVVDVNHRIFKQKDAIFYLRVGKGGDKEGRMKWEKTEFHRMFFYSCSAAITRLFCSIEKKVEVGKLGNSNAGSLMNEVS